MAVLAAMAEDQREEGDGVRRAPGAAGRNARVTSCRNSARYSVRRIIPLVLEPDLAAGGVDRSAIAEAAERLRPRASGLSPCSISSLVSISR